MAGTVRLGQEPSRQLPFPRPAQWENAESDPIKLPPAVLQREAMLCASWTGSCIGLGRTGMPPSQEPSDKGPPLPNPPGNPSS